MSKLPFFRLKAAELPWGDYSDILAHGMASTSDTDDSLEVERTGPFIPPISFPTWDYLVATGSFLGDLRESGLTGFDVLPVTLKKVTKVEWRNWDPYGPVEMQYPAGNEPENYVLRRKHSPEAAAALGELFWLRPRPGIRCTREGGFRLLAETWNRNDFFVVEGERASHNLVSQAAREWLETRVPEWVAFENVRE